MNAPITTPTYRIVFIFRQDTDDVDFHTIETDFTPMDIHIGDLIDSAFISTPHHVERPRFYEVVEKRHYFSQIGGEFQHSIGVYVVGRSDP